MKIILSILGVCLISFSSFSQELSSMPAFMGSIKAGKHFEPDSTYDQSWFKILDEEVKANKIFFTGENHNYRKINARLKFQLFKYLHENAGVNVFIAEMGWSCALIHNKYLQTADSGAWDVLSKYTYPSNQEMLKDLRAYWLEQPEDKKFIIAGVEFDREPEFGIKVLTQLVPETTPPLDSMRFETEALKFMDAYIEHDVITSHKYEYDEVYETVTTEQTDRYYNQFAFLKTFLDHYKRYKNNYKTWLGKDFEKWEMAIQSIEEYQKFDDLSNLPQGDIYREERMSQELDKIMSANKGNLYGQFGRCHINLQKDKEWCGFYYFRSLAYRMQQKPGLSDKVLSIPILYLDKVEDYKNSEFAMLSDYFSEIKDQLKSGITLIKLEGEDEIAMALKAKYKYIFIYKPYSEFEKQEAEVIAEESLEKAFEVVEKKKRWNTTTVGYGMNSLFKEPLHDFYNTPGLTTITQPGVYYSFATTSIVEKKKGSYDSKKSRVTMNENYVNFMVPNRQNIGDTLDVVLKSWQIGSHAGFDLLKKNKHFSLLIGYGFLYHQTKLKLYRYSNNITMVNPSVKPTMAEISNPAFMVDALIDFRYMRKGFCLFTRGGASYDLSNTHWRANGEILNNTPKTSWNAWYAQGGIGIAIESSRKGFKGLKNLVR